MTLNGVRQKANRFRQDLPPESGECGMALTLRDSSHLVSDPENLTLSVLEVFETMIGVVCETAPQEVSKKSAIEIESVTAVVGFGGILSGACVITCDESSARQIASCMT